MQQELGFKKPRDRGWFSRQFRSVCSCLVPRRHFNVLSRFCKLHLSSSSIGTQNKQGGEQPKMMLNDDGMMKEFMGTIDYYLWYTYDMSDRVSSHRSPNRSRVSSAA